MTLKRLLTTLAIALFGIAATTQCANAQFFLQGTNNAKTKWNQQKSDSYKIIYPQNFETTANRIANLLDTIAPCARFGMIRSNIPIPIVLETQNQYSNGMVVWAPKRMELVTTAPETTYATPWLRQLAIHEYRHAVQISNLNVGLGKVGSALLGQAGLGIVTAVISGWQYEGDATNAETQLTEFGRGLQPEFTIGYRALFHEKNHREIKKTLFVSGSFKNYYPNEYEYGYQMVRATETYLHPKVWGEIYNYSGRNAILIVPDYFYLKYKYKTSFNKIRLRAFDEMTELWKEHSAVDNNYKLLLSQPNHYTTYSYPMSIGNGSIFTLKDDFNTPTHIAVIDTNNNEKVRIFTGTISSRPTLYKDRIYWSEFKSHPFYEKQNYSVVKSIGEGEKKPTTHLKKQSHYFVTPTDYLIGAVANDSLGSGYIKFFDKDFKPVSERHFALPTTLHSLTWDNKTNRFAFIALDDNGMYLASISAENPDTDTVKMHLKHSAITLSGLTASGGALYFHSIQSGKDEIHTLDITTGVQRRLTRSQFGAKQPFVKGDTITFSSYTYKGWTVSKARVNDLLSDTVKWTRLPKNILNPNWVKWDIPKKVTDIKINDTTLNQRKAKKYSKFTHMFNLHSWAPIAVDVMDILNENQLSMGLGATGFFQSTLGDFYGNLAVGAKSNDFWTKGHFTYAALPVKFTVEAEYGGGDQSILYPIGTEIPTTPNDRKKANIGLTLAMPINLSGGRYLRSLQPTIDLNHYNSKLYNRDATSYKNGYQKWNASLWWAVSTRKAYREMLPRWGYALNTSVSGSLSDDFSSQYSFYARTYLPGMIRTHSTTLRAAYMMQNNATYNFTSKPLTPRGVTDNQWAKNYMAYSVDYLFPIIYPDWGLGSVIFIKRVALNAFADYSKGWYFNNLGGTTQQSNYSYGADLKFDLTLLNSFQLGVSFQFAMPNNDNLHFGLGFSAFF